jgi:hypothetical protein
MNAKKIMSKLIDSSLIKKEIPGPARSPPQAIRPEKKLLKELRAFFFFFIASSLIIINYLQAKL